MFWVLIRMPRQEIKKNIMEKYDKILKYQHFSVWKKKKKKKKEKTFQDIFIKYLHLHWPQI